MEAQVTSLGKPSNFKMYKDSRVWRDKRSSIHHFADASEGGYE